MTQTTDEFYIGGFFKKNRRSWVMLLRFNGIMMVYLFPLPLEKFFL